MGQLLHFHEHQCRTVQTWVEGGPGTWQRRDPGPLRGRGMDLDTAYLVSSCARVCAWLSVSTGEGKVVYL